MHAAAGRTYYSRGDAADARRRKWFPLCTISNGGTIVFLDKADPAAIVDAIERHGITTMFLPPTVIYSLLTMPDIRKRNFSSLRYFIYTAAPISPDKMAEALEIFGPVMAQGWGQAEAPLLCTFMGPADYATTAAEPNLLKSCGRATPFARVEIMATDGKLLGPGEIGEIVVRTNLAMDGYFNQPEETEKAFRFGWSIPATSATATTTAFSISLIATKT